MNKLLTRFLTVFTAAFSLANAGVLRAESLDVNEAKNAATSFLLSGNSNGMAKAKLRSGQYLTLAADNQNGYYIFNRQDGGIVIVADDDALGRTVLGYTTEGAYDPENLPVGLQDWFSQITVLMDAVHAGKIDRRESLSTQQGDIVVDALIKTKWNQYGPYNYLCPLVDGQRCLTGCVATAMAQIIYYWKWPEHGYGSVSYTAEDIKQNLSTDLSKTYYDWDNMLEEYTSTWDYDLKKWIPDCSDLQGNAVAELMRDCGYSVHMGYGLDASGASVSDKTLIDYFHYSPLAEVVYRENSEEKQWSQMLQNELDNKRPVLYSGDSEKGGHQFILDGYDSDNYFHVNWGWGGEHDGWFILTDLNSYNNGQRAIIGVEPVKNIVSGYKEEAFSYNLSNGTLTINGKGIMPAEYRLETAPWRDQCENIKKIVFEDGIINIPDYFGYYINEKEGHHFDNLEEVVLPEGLLVMESNFALFSPFQHLTLPSTLLEINESLWYCSNMQSLHIPANLRKIKCTGLTGLTEITIDTANPYFLVKDNVLLNKEGTSIIMTANAQNRLVIPETVKDIAQNAIISHQASVIVSKPMIAPAFPDGGFDFAKQIGFLYVKAGAKGYEEWLSKLPKGWKIRLYSDESQIPSGEFGWTLEDGVLTFTGIGQLPYNYNDRPFVDNSAEINKIKVKEGVTNLGWATFWGFKATTEIELPPTITDVDSQAFGYSGINKIVCLAKTAPKVSNFVGMQETGVLQVLKGCDYSSWLAALPSGWTIEEIEHPLIGKIDELKDYLLEIKTEGVNTKELDANKDGKLSVSDITEMARQLSE